MRVIVFGATGMVGQGALRECLRDDRVEQVLAVTRSALGQRHPKLRELVPPDFYDFSAVRGELAGYDACLFCLGVSSLGMDEAAYRRVTYDLTLAAATLLAELNPELVFEYVSGQGTDGTGTGRRMWARVKGQTENALLALPFRGYMLRPGFIQPRYGVTSRTGWYRAVYRLTGGLYPVLRRLFPGSVTTTEHLGRAMLAVARDGAPKRVLENRDINTVAAAYQ
ncbi:MAG TPA: epimerase [Rugosimonospora sp.]|nr:epimerase [Rugosimonospora sp.]